MSKVITLSDGRSLAYEEFGPPDGQPLLIFHGNPGSRLDIYLMEPDSINRNDLRIIAPDRPGIGQSTFQPGRKILDWPEDVAALADALELDGFAALGISCGSPYLAACAYAIPERLTAAGIVSGTAPFNVPGVMKGMGPGRYYFLAAQRVPFLARQQLKMMGMGVSSAQNREKFTRQMLSTLPEADKETLSDPTLREAFFDSIQEGLKQSPHGMVYDAALINQSWGFDLQAIQIPVHIWHGEADRNAPVAMGCYMGETIPNSRAKFIPGEGHLSVFVRYLPEILEGLLPSSRK
jgi:pimeloyl-ACP methyl ester carboxylesterase